MEHISTVGEFKVHTNIPFLGLNIVRFSHLSEQVQFGLRKLTLECNELKDLPIYNTYPLCSITNESIKAPLMITDYLPYGLYMFIFYSNVTGKHMRYDKVKIDNLPTFYTMLPNMFDEKLFSSEERKYKISLI
jgi:hypothetical protein